MARGTTPCMLKRSCTNEPYSLLPVLFLSFILVACNWRFLDVVVDAFTVESTQRVRSARLAGANGYAPTKLCAQDGGSVAETDKVSCSGSGKRVVIVGGGIGGLASAYDARHILDKSTEIVVVSDKPYFSFVPSNPWVAIRKRKPSDIQLPLADILPRHGVQFVHDRAERLDPGSNSLTLASGKKLSYDYLIIATGPRLAWDRVPGLDKAGVSICTTLHAVRAADRIDKLEKDPGPVVCGATQGASCFGPAYEFLFLLQHELKLRGGQKLVDACPMTFVTPEPEVGHLGLNGAGDSKFVLKALMQKNKIQAFTNTRTVKVTETGVTVEQLDKKGKVIQRKVLQSKLTMLIPAFEGMDTWKRVPGLTDKEGLVEVNEYQQSLAFANIFAVGATVKIPHKIESVVECNVPKTGYFIESQGTAAVNNIKSLMTENRKNKKADSIAGEKAVPTDTSENARSAAELPLHSRALLNALCVADFGSDGAIFITMPCIPPRRHDWTIHSRLATLAKTAFEKYFLRKVKTGDTDPYYEKYMLKLVGVERTKEDVQAAPAIITTDYPYPSISNPRPNLYI